MNELPKFFLKLQNTPLTKLPLKTVLKTIIVIFLIIAGQRFYQWAASPTITGAIGNHSPHTRLTHHLARQVSQVVMGGSDPLLYLPLMLQPATGPIPFGPVHSGEGTYYDATGDGNCAFGPSPNDLMVAALNFADYANSALCGAYIQANGPNGSVMVRIVDSCPPCAPGDVDFSPQAFTLIADLSAGRVPVTWQLVSPPLDGPIVYHFKDGSNQWWTAVQIRNHRNPIARFEYLGSDGSFHEVPRESYNYFVQSSGMGPGPYTFRVTDMSGHVLVDSGIPHIENGDVPGSGQFPPP